MTIGRVKYARKVEVKGRKSAMIERTTEGIHVRGTAKEPIEVTSKMINEGKRMTEVRNVMEEQSVTKEMMTRERDAKTKLNDVIEKMMTERKSVM